jgi:hypothetical protein
MRILSPTLVAGACALASLSAGAQTLRPGLWEMQHRVKGDARMEQQMADMQKQLSSMSPEERQQMEAMMAGRGMQVSPADGGGAAMRICITREMAERNDIPTSRGECKTGPQQRSGNTLKMTFTCTDPPSSGDTQVTFHGSEAYTTRTNVTSTVGGKPETMSMEGSGKWLAADCGNVKPMQSGK